jgi:endonuclease G
MIMANKNRDRLKSYLELITKTSGGLEVAIETARKKVAEKRFFETLPSPGQDPRAAQSGLESMAMGRDISDSEFASMEAIINADLRPAPLIINGTFTITHELWSRLSTDPEIKARIERVIPSVGRIELPHNPRYPYGGTGFVVGQNLIMTNRHVAEIFASGLGDRSLNFINGAEAGIDFLRELKRPTGPTLSVRRIVMIHPYWDMAILEVDGLDRTHRTLELSLSDARDMTSEQIFVIGYPFYDPRNPPGEQDQLFSGDYGVKRLQPGQLQGGVKVGSFGKEVDAAAHDCSTLGGNSGSAVFNLKTGEVLALHFGGQYHDKNYGVPSLEMSRDSRIVQAGVKFSGTPSGGPNSWGSWWQEADGGLGQDRESEQAVTTKPRAPDTGVLQSPPATVTVAKQGAGAVTIEVPLRITISLGAPLASPRVETVETVSTDTLEGMKQPWHDTDYSSRKGYDPAFLGSIEVPMPAAKHPGVLARAKDGRDVLDYQNFSIRMHAQRRLALVTASNIAREAKLRRPDPSQDYTRKGLTRLGKNDQEKWFYDPRLEDRYQLPDIFFVKDRGAFDKGHIVRREDVAWGQTYDLLVRANGDSFHVTNCSPQVANYNRSNLGVDNWGNLENVVFSEASSERLCVFAGPVLDPSDQVFIGRGDGGQQLAARIPTRFWKVIVARAGTGIAAFGFVLEQDLSKVDWEFTVPAEFIPYLTKISDIEAMTGVAFSPELRNADQFGTQQGPDIAQRAGARIRKSPG